MTPVPDRAGNYWLEQIHVEPAPAALGTLTAEVVIVGGGIAGLSAARSLLDLGKDVVLLEADTCGSGATGRSSGFITPDSELELCNLVARVGDADAARLWRAARNACARMRADVDAWHLSCDLVDADSFYVARSARHVASIEREHEVHQRLGFESRLHGPTEIADVLGGEGFAAGVRTPGTFGMNTFAYARGLQRHLVARGLRCFEHSPVVEVRRADVRTPAAVIRAGAIVLCLDRDAPSLGIAARDVFHAQAFLTLTEPLDEATWRSIFPTAPLLVWDSDLVYQYFRRTGEGRLLVGGGRLLETYAAEHPQSSSFAKLERYARARFAVLRDACFTHAWQGLIGVSKDVMPLAGQSPAEPGHYLALCGAGRAGRRVRGRAGRGSGSATRALLRARAPIPLDRPIPIAARQALHMGALVHPGQADSSVVTS